MLAAVAREVQEFIHILSAPSGGEFSLKSMFEHGLAVDFELFSGSLRASTPLSSLEKGLLFLLLCGFVRWPEATEIRNALGQLQLDWAGRCHCQIFESSSEQLGSTNNEKTK